MGPRSRELLSLVSPNDFSNEAHHITYVGELGWELYVPTDRPMHVFQTLVEAGEQVGLKLCGLHAMDSCRIELAYRHFAVRPGKGDFIGRALVLCKREAGLSRRLL